MPIASKNVSTGIPFRIWMFRNSLSEVIGAGSCAACAEAPAGKAFSDPTLSRHVSATPIATNTGAFAARIIYPPRRPQLKFSLRVWSGGKMLHGSGLARQLDANAIGHEPEETLVSVLANDQRVGFPFLPDLQPLQPVEEAVHDRVIQQFDVDPLTARSVGEVLDRRQVLLVHGCGKPALRVEDAAAEQRGHVRAAGVLHPEHEAHRTRRMAGN